MRYEYHIYNIDHESEYCSMDECTINGDEKAREEIIETKAILSPEMTLSECVRQDPEAKWYFLKPIGWESGGYCGLNIDLKVLLDDYDLPDNVVNEICSLDADSLKHSLLYILNRRVY